MYNEGPGYVCCSVVLSHDRCVEDITHLVSSHIVSASLTRSHGKELDYTLPLDSVSKFAGEFPCIWYEIFFFSVLSDCKITPKCYWGRPWYSGSALDCRSSDRSCGRGMIHNNIHVICLGYPRPSITLQCRIVAQNTNRFKVLRI